jgi:hypothetical protein
MDRQNFDADADPATFKLKKLKIDNIMGLQQDFISIFRLF